MVVTKSMKKIGIIREKNIGKAGYVQIRKTNDGFFIMKLSHPAYGLAYTEKTNAYNILLHQYKTIDSVWVLGTKILEMYKDNPAMVGVHPRFRRNEYA